ncbi:hypothetical protein VM1G_06422 [Cytospora mali]|uniref:Thaumatin-like protein 1 n=1 Tax=Cytospora mali TaxID=578113 RepID=A0A194W1J4_CYTMA|nr:hypothetical protein VM1G_06422 [Valsa mali]
MFTKMHTTLISLLTLLSLTNALPSGPLETPPPAVNKRQGFAYHAEKLPHKARATSAPSHLTITVVNKMSEAVSTSYVANGGAPAVLAGNTGAGTMAASATASIVAPSGWAGNIAVGLAKYPMNGDVSLLEGSLMDQGNGYPVVDMDVSYVNGFSVPITCSCNDDNKVLSGCNLDLWKMGSCSGSSGTDDGQGACANPLRPDNSASLTATSFFLPCQGAAFTWPRDDANSNEGCQSGQVTCCVGTDGCPSNPKQAS